MAAESFEVSGARTQPLQSPEEELAYLREQIARKEAELAALQVEKPREHIAQEQLVAHRSSPLSHTHAESFRLPESDATKLAENLDPESDDATMLELKALIETKGVKNAFAVLEKLGNAHLDDDFHRFLVQYLVEGMPPKQFDEGKPLWRALHMTLYQIALPEVSKEQSTKPLKEILSGMEQVYAGMLAIQNPYADEPPYFTLELAVPVDSPGLQFYASVPSSRADLFEKLVLAVFPHARITPEPNDYNIFVQEGTSTASYALLSRPAPLPIKDYSQFDYDPINSLLNAFAKIAPEGEGAQLQIVLKPEGTRTAEHFKHIISELQNGAEPYSTLRQTDSFTGVALRDIKSTLFGNPEKDKEERERRRASGENKDEIEAIERKIATPILSANLRLAASAATPERAEQLLRELEAAFHQFEDPQGNKLDWHRASPQGTRRLLHDYAFRLFEDRAAVPLSIRELATVYHFPPQGIQSSPNLVQSRFATAAPPAQLPREGLVLGVNEFRGQKTQVRLSEADRLRHLYVVGQTGTGKSSFMTTLIAQDIANGEGCCFIDPHGNDVVKILETIPPERYEDVIYFDPAYLDRPYGLNLLEYDPQRPEQKTFIVNELLAIFRRLYGDVPESMGPAFEQYFRNATLLVMEDPESGSTMMDIGRVLTDARFREHKLSRSNNPVINQFWREIATKAGGDASLENIVPYITNKFDDFTANDFMRPIIGQQESTLRFREIMDQKKILLVNLSKGRLGERNANLLGLIIVGKLFMAALSRADQPGANFPPFYTYIDEFQNITTDSIPAILSEARKYKLSLTLAHQFLAQIDQKARDAVFGNVGSMTVFRVGQEDGEFFEKLFAPVFTASDFTSIENLNAYTRILANGVPQKPFNFRMLPFVQGNPNQVDDLRALSYLTYGRDRATVEASIRNRYLS